MPALRQLSDYIKEHGRRPTETRGDPASALARHYRNCLKAISGTIPLQMRTLLAKLERQMAELRDAAATASCKQTLQESVEYLGQQGALPKENRMPHRRRRNRSPNKTLARRLRCAMKSLELTTDIPSDIQELREKILNHSDWQQRRLKGNRQTLQESHEYYRQTLQESVDYLRQQGALPKENRNAPSYGLARRLRRALTSLEFIADKPSEVQELHAMILKHSESEPGWLKGERDRYRYVLKQRQTVMRTEYREWCMAHNQEPRPELPSLQCCRNGAQGQTWVGQSPYPGFINLGNTCWMNAVLQCVFHCHAFRQSLHDQENGSQESCVAQVTQLLRDYSDGSPISQLANSRAKADILAPHDFLDFVIETNPRFAVGLQHDAMDFLSWLLEHSKLGYDCCYVGKESRNDNAVILLREFRANTTQAEMCETTQLDIQKLLQSSLQCEDTRLRSLPSVLVMRVPQFIHEDDDDTVERVCVVSNCLGNV